MKYQGTANPGPIFKASSVFMSVRSIPFHSSAAFRGITAPVHSKPASCPTCWLRSGTYRRRYRSGGTLCRPCMIPNLWSVVAKGFCGPVGVLTCSISFVPILYWIVFCQLWLIDSHCEWLIVYGTVVERNWIGSIPSRKFGLISPNGWIMNAT